MRHVFSALVMVMLLVNFPFMGLPHSEQMEEPASGFGFGGPMIGLFTLDLGGADEADSINGVLVANGYAPLPERMVTFGGGGRGGVIGGFSFGGSGWGESVTSIRAGKKAELSLGFGGMEAAYAIGGNVRSLLFLGAVLGGGGADLKLRARIPESFQDAIANPTSTTLSLGFFAAEPYVRFQVQPLDWLGFEVRLGYLFTLAGNWEEAGQEIAGPPLNLCGPFVGLSVSFGGIERVATEKTIEDIPEELPEDTEG